MLVGDEALMEIASGFWAGLLVCVPCCKDEVRMWQGRGIGVGVLGWTGGVLWRGGVRVFA